MNNQNTRRIVTIALLIVMTAFFALTTEFFLSYRNLSQLLLEAAYIGIVALGTSFVIVGGGVDLSGGGMMCFLGVVVARSAMLHNLPGFVILIIALICGALCGLLNAVIVLKLRLTEFVTTLATGSVFNGLALLTIFRQGDKIVATTIANRSFLALGRPINGIYYVSIAWVVLTIIMQFILKKTKFGLYTVAMGSNPGSAAMSGMNCDRLKMITFMIGGAFAGLSAAFLVAYQTGTTLQTGFGMAFKAVAACVVGGLVLGGGKGDPVASFLGALVFTLITNGLYKWGLSTAGMNIMQGVIILVALTFDAVLNIVSEKRLTANEQL